MKQDKDIKEFLKEVKGGQSLNLSVWANSILKRKNNEISMEELERCFSIGL